MMFPEPRIFHPPYSTIYESSPYSENDLIKPDSDYFTSLGYVYIGQESRGLQGSGGNYSFWRTAGNDSLDTILWWKTYSQGWGNGQLAVAGISADCITQYADVTGVTQSGYWPNGNYSYFEDLFRYIRTGVLALGSALGRQTVFQGGAYRQGLVSGWLQDLGEAQMIQTIWEHEAWDYWWYPLQGSYENQWAMYNTTAINFAGWYDIFSSPQIWTVDAVNTTAQPGARGQQLLFVDPGGHCVIGDIPWVEDLLGWEYMLAEIAPLVLARVFESSLNGKPFNVHDYVDWNVFFYVLGPGIIETGLFWVKAESFPPFTNTNWYFAPGGKLSPSQPTSTTSTVTTYKYDPFNPVPTWGGNNLIIQPCGPQNQNVVESNRTDVLHFDSANITDTFALVGMISVNLFVSSSAPDTDFTAKLIDIFPDGRAMLVQDSIIRMRWRNGPFSTQNAPPMQSNETYNVTIDVGFMSYIFNAGHKIRVSISSSNYPRFSANYNSGLNMIYGNKSAQVAMNSIHYGSILNPSHVTLPIVSLQWLEDRKVVLEDLHEKLDEREQEWKNLGFDIKRFARDMKKKIFNKKL
ncbi:peptidase S15 [Reticulomyxa filosa]|uniref:Peptidase S15 n=1 Tax=Reticulomyxa filosa TaxID=46433 RepID=X6NJS1_RETFI|nr:peptidase S15 [Reticulomyxa filosa]|eukprot:ETO25964.1 peptidase S15 [Reticulomyxa filosa]